MQRKMKFALFGNTYQEHKSAHVTHLLEILRRKEAHICIHREFYEFLRLHTNADLTNLEIFNGHDFTADMALSVGGDGTFLKTASLVGNKEIPILVSIPDAWDSWPIFHPTRWRKPLMRFIRECIWQNHEGTETYLQWSGAERLSLRTE